jgi:hypothetical protein
VASVALRPEGAIALAGHGGDAVTWFDQGAGSFVTSRAYGTRMFQPLRRFLRRFPYERDRTKVWSLQDPDESYAFVDDGAIEQASAGWTSTFPHPLSDNGAAGARFFERWQKSPLSDAYLQRMAISLVDSLRLGQRQATDFLGVEFSALDLVSHDFGPRSREVEDVLVRLDVTLGTFIERLDRRVGRDNYALALTGGPGEPHRTAGHDGDAPRPEEIRQLVERVLISQFGPRADAYAEAVAANQIYLAPGVLDRLRNEPTAMVSLERALRAVPGVRRVLRRDQLTESNRDPLVRAAALGQAPARSGDFILVAQPMPAAEAEVPLILLGHGRVAGRFGTPVTPADIAPTLARLPDVTLQRADGRALP